MPPGNSRKVIAHFPEILLCAFLAFCPTKAAAQDSVTLLETDPPSPATLNNWENFSLRIGYAVSRPVQVKAEAFNGGAPVPGTSSGMGFYDTGSGEAFYWISYYKSAHIDRIDISAVDAATGAVVATASAPVDVTWTGVAASTRRQAAPWVAQLQAERDRHLKDGDAFRMAHQSPAVKLVGGFATVAAMVAFVCVPGYFIAQVILLIWWRGSWRRRAAAPLVPMGLVILYVIVAIARGSNIAPVVLVFAAPIACLYFVVIGVTRYSSLKAGGAKA